MPTEESPAKIPSADISAEGPNPVQSTSVDPASAEVTPQHISIDSYSSHSSVGSPPLSSSLKQTPSRRVSRASFISSLEQVMSDIGRQACQEAHLQREN